MTPSQKSRWEKKAQEYAGGSANHMSVVRGYLQGASDCFSEMSGRIDKLRDALEFYAHQVTYEFTREKQVALTVLKEDDHERV